MRIYRVQSEPVIRDWITNPGYLEISAQDRLNLNDVRVNPAHIYLTAGGDGFTVFMPVSPCCVRVHGFGRSYGKGAHEFFSDCLSWARTNLAITRIETSVAEIFPGTRNFLIKHGFECEGVQRRSFIKSGQVYDSWMMGLIWLP